MVIGSLVEERVALTAIEESGCRVLLVFLRKKKRRKYAQED